jgi:hypothetical protein
VDIVAHALWAAVAANAVNRRDPGRVRVAWFAAWAAFPDLFAFTPEVATRLWYRVSGAAQAHGQHHHFGLYELSHSLVVFVPVFALAWLLFRRPVWELLGWALHVLMDIPTHSAHFPTPFLWPLSSYQFFGISWRQWWFTALNYSALALAFLFLWIDRRRARRAGERAQRGDDADSS